MAHIEIKKETRKQLNRYIGELMVKRERFISADSAIQELLAEHAGHKLKAILAEEKAQ